MKICFILKSCSVTIVLFCHVKANILGTIVFWLIKAALLASIINRMAELASKSHQGPENLPELPTDATEMTRVL